jgi:hypothetical protein
LISKHSSICRSCSTVWINRLNFQIRDTNVKHKRFCASRSTIVSLSLSLSLYIYIYVYIYIYELGYSATRSTDDLCATDRFSVCKVQMIDLTSKSVYENLVGNQISYFLIFLLFLKMARKSLLLNCS